MKVFILLAIINGCFSQQNTDIRHQNISSPFRFIYNWSQDFNVEIQFKNIPSDFISYQIVFTYGNFPAKSDPKPLKDFNPECRRSVLKQPKVSIEAELYDGNDVVQKILIVDGIQGANLLQRDDPNTMKYANYTPSDVCSRPECCTIEVDLGVGKVPKPKKSSKATPVSREGQDSKRHHIVPMKTKTTAIAPKHVQKFDETYTNITQCIEVNTDEKPGISRKLVLICGISSVGVACAVLLLVCVCIRRCRNKRASEQTIKYNSATSNCVLYADLDIRQTENRTPVYVEESPYAEIIGVLEPDKKGRT
nr:uncharacterized protein LOC110377726 [Helicoverpa armigera]